MHLPPPDLSIVARRAEIVAGLREIMPGHVISDDESLAVYDCDALTALRQKPLCAVLPGTVAEVAAILRYCRDAGVNVVPRGAGTSLSGGSIPLGDGILLVMARLNRIVEVDYENRCAVVQPGVTNLAITHAVEERGFYYAPDPSSQLACSIGGNVAENSGGVHCLKYGLTTNNLLGVEMVLIDGSIVTIGGKCGMPSGYDLLGIVTGSEGLLGVVTEVTVRILPKPPLARALLMGFPSIESAGQCVADIIAAGIIPAGLELMDRVSVGAMEAFCAPGYPLDAEGVLVAELDGTPTEVNTLIARVEEIALKAGANSCRTSSSEAERLKIWAGRKAAFAATGRIAPDMLCMDGTIPRRELPAVMRRIRAMSESYGLPVANVFHAGDGNLHPLILYDVMKPGDLEKADAFGADILRLCVEVGGVLTGEHGVGIEKRDLMPVMFDAEDLAQQQRLKCAFDPTSRLNPGKVFPTLHRCAELGQVHVRGGQFAHPEIPRL
ncbi:putative FAD-linked oxidoreductase [Alphaproteobacteria bacterium SO-S41]|nr:putative FAD-linked oxidoreductase [Alphaproteobacteria bacterium SO-S41]